MLVGVRREDRVLLLMLFELWNYLVLGHGYGIGIGIGCYGEMEMGGNEIMTCEWGVS